MLKRGADLGPVSGMAGLLLEGVGRTTRAGSFRDGEWDSRWPERVVPEVRKFPVASLTRHPGPAVTGGPAPFVRARAARAGDADTRRFRVT
ncbi:hypothetical protein Srufu_066970 [Streptomyces libani subsp. rufus]|nr:hypothetical protein Srufu_066970 [Streptomyces libani subsp. rufus]